MKHLLHAATLGLFLCWAISLYAQKPIVPTPGKASDKTVYLTGATAHLGNGETIPTSVVSFKNGKIEMVADMTRVKLNTEGAEVIDISGKHIYPGLIACNTTLGLVEMAAVRATRDRDEVGDLNPNIRSIVAYNTDSHVIPTVRSNGILTAQVTPQGGTITGQSSVVQLDAWNWEDAAYKTDDAMILNFPSMVSFSWEEGKLKANEDYQKQYSELLRLFGEAKAYCGADSHTAANLKLQALCRVLDGSQKLHIRANFAKDIVAAVNFSQKIGAKIVIVGGSDAWQVTDLLKANNVPVIIHQTHALPNRDDEDVYLPSKLPKLLKDAGVLSAIAIGDNWDGFWQLRNLPFHAGTAATFGLTKEEALQSITQNAAKILGIDQTIGTLEAGKDATLIVSDGDILDMATNHITHAFIQGRPVDLDNKQKALYRRYMDKYGFQPKE